MDVRVNPLLDRRVVEALSLSLSPSLCVCLSLSVSPSLCVCLSPSLSLSIFLASYRSFFFLSVYLSIFLIYSALISSTLLCSNLTYPTLT